MIPLEPRAGRQESRQVRESAAACAHCGRPVSSRVAGGACLPCLLAVGFDEAHETGAAVDPTAFGGRFGDFEIDRDADGQARELGRGAMGVTYRAHDAVLNRPVALKVINAAVAGHPEASARFLSEARGAAALRHPNVASIFQYGVRDADGQPFYAMELVEGETLWERVRRSGPLPVGLALEICVQVARALQAAEAGGIVHRDLKPSNLILASDPHPADTNAPTVKMIDFGLARAVSAATAAADGENEPLTERELFAGTPAYASPEQFADDVPVDVRSDIYALGATLWFLLTGRSPFEGRTLAEIHRQQTGQPLPFDLLQKVSGERAPVATLLRAMLSPDPAGRPQSARELLAALARCQRALAAPAIRRRRVLIVAGALALAGFSAVVTRRMLPPAPAPAALTAPDRSLAVLPFENLSSDPANAFFAEGVQQEVQTDLAGIAGFKVISQGSVRRYLPHSDARTDLLTVGRSLGVAHLVAGSVERVGERLRVRVELLDARTGFQEWAKTFDRAAADLSAIQHDIAAALADRLGGQLGERERTRAAPASPTPDPAAYELFLRAKAAMNTDKGGDSPQMYDYILRLLGEAIARDPNLARAYAETAHWNALYYFRNYDRSPRRIEQVRAAADEAVRLAPGSAEAHDAQGVYQYYIRRDYGRAQQEFATAAQAASNDAYARLMLGLSERRQGHWESALAHFQQAEALDPFNVDVGFKVIETLAGLHRYAEMRAEGERWAAKDPRAIMLRYNLLYWSFVGDGQLESLRRAVGVYPVGEDQDGSGTTVRLNLALCERNYPAAIHVLAGTSVQNFATEIQGQWFPRALLAADAAVIGGEVTAVQPDLLAARPRLEQDAQEHPNDAAAGLTLARLDAYLGRHGEALAEGRRALAVRPPVLDAYDGPRLALQFAAVLALVGEREQAVTLLCDLATHPLGPEYGDLLLRPDWDSLRGDQRFEALVRSLAPAKK